MIMLLAFSDVVKVTREKFLRPSLCSSRMEPLPFWTDIFVRLAVVCFMLCIVRSQHAWRGDTVRIMDVAIVLVHLLPVFPMCFRVDYLAVLHLPMQASHSVGFSSACSRGSALVCLILKSGFRRSGFTDLVSDWGLPENSSAGLCVDGPFHCAPSNNFLASRGGARCVHSVNCASPADLSLCAAGCIA